MLPPALLKDAIVYANLLLMLTIGFTLTYLIAKIPNFAHGEFAGIGIYVSFTVVQIWKMNPYIAVPLAFIVSAIIGVIIYNGVLRTLKKFGGTLISLTISTLAMQIIISALINVYADYLYPIAGAYSRLFMFRHIDFEFMGQPGVLIVSSLLVFTLIIVLHLILTKTKFGISLRAVVEDSDLASVLGVNVEFACTISWALTGGLAGMAGALLPLWFQGHPYTGSMLLTSVFAASILGGISSIYGAMLGGYLIGLSEVFGTYFLAQTFGSQITAYRMLIPLIILCIVLLLAPRGLTGVIEDLQAKRISKKIVRMGG
ncbi:MAG: branched-chain amino acid ABC transporter permease [Candidatus Methanomethylicia archaeon]